MSIATIYHDVEYDFLFHLINSVTMETTHECMNTIIIYQSHLGSEKSYIFSKPPFSRGKIFPDYYSSYQCKIALGTKD